MRTRSPAKHANVSLAKRFWAATAEGDAGALEATLSDKVVWRVHGHNPLSGEYRGPDAMMATIADFGDHVDDTRLSMLDLYASAHGAVISYRLWARRGEREVDLEILARLTIEDGLLTRCDVVPMDQAAMDAFLNWIH